MRFSLVALVNNHTVSIITTFLLFRFRCIRQKERILITDDLDLKEENKCQSLFVIGNVETTTKKRKEKNKPKNIIPEKKIAIGVNLPQFTKTKSTSLNFMRFACRWNKKTKKKNTKTE